VAPIHGSVHNIPGNLPSFFGDPNAAYNAFRQPILGLDTKDGGWGYLRGLGYWNVDFSLKKTTNITEKVNLDFQVVFTNLFNHVIFYDPGFGGPQANDYLDTSSGPDGFGTLPGQGNLPRTMEFGLRLNF
jgi:hypothetical protein